MFRYHSLFLALLVSFCLPLLSSSSWAAQESAAVRAAYTREWTPLVIDKNKDGKVSSSEDLKVYFDVFSTGFRNATSWINLGDAFLVFDKNSNGRIDNGAEIVGTSYLLTDPSTLDDNKDRAIDEKDASFTKLMIWRDLSIDGVSQTNDLQRVTGSISKTPDGKYVLNMGGETFSLESTTLYADKANTVTHAKVPLLFSVLALPEQRGYGSVPNLSLAMSAKPELLKSVQELSSIPIEKAFLDFNKYLAQFDQILYLWAGVEKIDPQSRGPWVDARQLALMETITGKKFNHMSGTSNPPRMAGAGIGKAYDHMRASCLARFLTQSGGSSLFQGGITYDRLSDDLFFSGSGDVPALSLPVIERLKAESENTKDKLSYWTSALFYIHQVRGSLDNIDLPVANALDSAIKNISPQLTFNELAKKYISVLPCAPCFEHQKVGDSVAKKTKIAERAVYREVRPAEEPVNPAIAAVPLPLLKTALSFKDLPEDEYIKRNLVILREYGRTKDQLDLQDINAIREKSVMLLRRVQVQVLIAYDRDFDGRVSREEIEAAISEKPNNKEMNKEIITVKTEKIMKLDRNSDGIIDTQEMSTLPDDAHPEILSKDQEALLSLDPNGDGVLTMMELEQIARGAFKTFDTDNDGTLSKQERSAVRTAVRSIVTADTKKVTPHTP